MNITYCTDYDELSQMACDSIVSDLKKHPKQMLCTATGNSPTGTYKRLVKAYDDRPEHFDGLTIIKLDEWGGIDSEAPYSCESYLQKKLIQPLQIPQERFISFDPNPVSPEEECKRMQQKIEQIGPMDCCILGLGKNGHIGFNEPGHSLTINCHTAQLTADSLNHQMINDLIKKPNYGLTLGMADILQSKKIILLITGANKKKIIQKFLSKKISTEIPASFLWLHANVACFIDSTAL